MRRMELIAPCHFGLEAVLKREIIDLGYEISEVEDGRVTFIGDEEAICRANVFLRTAERILIKVGSFKATSFEELFEATKSLRWEEYIPRNGKFWVAKAASIKSKLFSPSDIQSIMKKAMVERMKQKYHREHFEEDGVSYPVVKGTDNDQYLHMTYEKNYNFAGTIFIDYENKADFSDCNTLVYGHNMKNGTMFGQLKNFSKDDSAYNKSKYFWIFTPEKTYRYEIISAYTTAVNSDTYTLFKGPGQEFVDYMNKIVSYSDVKTTPGELGVDDKIVTLSTCTGNESTRYVVQGKRVDTLDVVKKSDSTKQTGDN